MEKINGGTLESFIKAYKNGTKKSPLDIQNLSIRKQVVSADNSPSLRYIVVPEEIASSITKDICLGLSQIHKKNYIHRDLKPENILINELQDGTFIAKIADFGLTAEVHANVFTGQDKITSVAGTILYMAPEQATG